MNDFLSFFDLAKRLNVGYDTVRRLVSRYGTELGIAVERRKTPTSKGALTQCVSPDDANKLIAFFESKVDDPAGKDEEFSFQRFGYFYLIQLVPEALPNRIKIGFADNVEQRLNEHRTAAPTARLLKAWPCKRSWDSAAMDSITREGCRLVLNEVFEGDVDGFLRRAESFFSVMPNPDSQRELSEHSPLFEPGDRGGESPSTDDAQQVVGPERGEPVL